MVPTVARSAKVGVSEVLNELRMASPSLANTRRQEFEVRTLDFEVLFDN
jgi:hypothetical protein